MSLWGRYMIDKVKHAVSHRVTLPVPPYGNTAYWNKVYDTLGPEDVYEWGGVSFSKHLARHKYRLLYEYPNEKKSTNEEIQSIETTFEEVIRVKANNESKICLLGCGNSKMGEEMVGEGWAGRLLQVDISPRVLETTSQRCEHMVGTKMDFVQDDATQLSAFDDNHINAVVDKGLVDALFCANEFEQVEDVMHSVHRVLKPGCLFTVFSFSAPQYLLPCLLPEIESERRPSKNWQNVQVRELDTILMYRFQKRQELNPNTYQKKPKARQQKNRSKPKRLRKQ